MTDIPLWTTPDAPEASPLLDGLTVEYDGRYGGTPGRGSARDEIDRYPAIAFAAPYGAFLVLQRDGQTVAGGAFMPHDDDTAEIKRVWTHPGLRRQGLSRSIMRALEDRAAGLGYSRLYLTTGFRQPEAVALYLSLGYRPLFDQTADPALYRSLPFEKHIGAKAGQPGTAPQRRPATTFDAANAEVKAKGPARSLACSAAGHTRRLSLSEAGRVGAKPRPTSSLHLPLHFGPEGLDGEAIETHVRRKLHLVRLRLAEQIEREWLLAIDADAAHAAAGAPATGSARC